MNDAFLKPEKLLNPLFKMAVLSGVQAAVRLHIRRGIDLNAIDEKGRSPLILAVSKGHAETCRILLEAGADPRILDNEGNDALSIALDKRLDNLAELLKERLSELGHGLSTGASDPDPASSENESSDPLNAADETFDFSGWESEEESPVPPQDDECLAKVSTTHQAISAHIPIDNDEDWSDVDIDLPGSQRNHRRIWNDEIRNEVLRLILVALQESHASNRWIEDVALDNKGDSDLEFEGHLVFILEELGVIVDDVEWLQPDISFPLDEDMEDIDCLNNQRIKLKQLRANEARETEKYPKGVLMENICDWVFLITGRLNSLDTYGWMGLCNIVCQWLEPWQLACGYGRRT